MRCPTWCRIRCPIPAVRAPFLHRRIRHPRNPAPMESRMQILIVLGLTAVAVLQTSSFGGALSQSQPLLVRAVVNGDTIDVATVGRVRLLGIDAPAAGRGTSTPAPFGREALD